MLLVDSLSAQLSTNAKAASDDCGGFLFGSVVLAEAGHRAARAAAGRFFGRVALHGAKVLGDDSGGFVFGSMALTEADGPSSTRYC
jgi:hypothetical protein